LCYSLEDVSFIQLDGRVSAEKKYNLKGISIRNNYKYIYLINKFIFYICENNIYSTILFSVFLIENSTIIHIIMTKQKLKYFKLFYYFT